MTATPIPGSPIHTLSNIELSRFLNVVIQISRRAPRREQDVIYDWLIDPLIIELSRREPS